MDDQKYIKINGVMIPAPLDDSKFEDTSVEEISSNLPSFKPGSLGRNMYTFNNEVVDIAKKYNIDLQRDMKKEDLNKYLANAQSWEEQFVRMLGQMVVSEIALGTVLGFSDIADWMINIGKAYGEDDWTNPVSSKLTEWQDALKEQWKIYRENPEKSWDITDSAWWFDNGVQIGSTLSLMIPAAGVTRGISYIGKLTKFDRLLNKASYNIAKGIRSVSALRKGEQATSGFTIARNLQNGMRDATRSVISRQMEDMLEGRETYKQVKQSTDEQLKNMTVEEREEFFARNPEFVGKSDEEISRYIADKAAQNTFEKDFKFVLTDFLAWKSVGHGYLSKTPTRKLNNAQINTLQKIAGIACLEAENTMTKLGVNVSKRNWLSYYAEHPSLGIQKTLGSLSLEEGVEEFGQGLVQKKSEEIGYKYFDPKYTERSMASYLRDGQLWEQAFWGAIGGITFGAAHKGFDIVIDKVKLASKKDKLSKEDILNLELGEERTRRENIESWATEFAQMKAKMDLYNQGYNPYTEIAEEDKNGRIHYRKANKEGEYEQLTDDNREAIKNKILDEFVDKTAYKAIDYGTINYLEALINDPVFDEAIKKVGGSTIDTDATLNRMKTQLAKSIQNYGEALYNVFANTNVESEAVGRAVARNIAANKFRIDQLDTMLNYLNNEINKQLDSKTDDSVDYNVSDSYHKAKLREQLLDIFKDLYKQVSILKNKNIGKNSINETFRNSVLDELRRVRNEYIKLMQDVIPFTEALKDENGNVKLDESGNALYNTIDLLQKVLNEEEISNEEEIKLLEAIDNFSPKDFGKTGVTEQTRKLIDRKVAYELEKAKTQAMIPTTDSQLKEAVKDMEAAFGDIISSRVNKDLQSIVDYIQNSENPLKTYQALNTNSAEDKDIQEKYNNYKTGSPYYGTYTEVFKNAARSKQVEKEATRDSSKSKKQTQEKQTQEKQTKREENQNEANKTVEPNKNKEEIDWSGEIDDTVPSTGELEYDEEERIVFNDDNDLVFGEDEIDWEDYNDMNFYAASGYQDEKDDIIFTVAKAVRDYYLSLSKEEQARFVVTGKNKTYIELFNSNFYKARELYKKEGMRDGDIANAVHEGIIEGIKSINRIVSKNKDDISTKISNSLIKLYETLNGISYDKQGNMIKSEEYVSSGKVGRTEFVNKAIEEFLNEYIQLHGNQKTPKGKYVINVDEFFKYLAKYDIDTVKKLYNTFVNFFINYKGDTYYIKNKTNLTSYLNQPNLYFEKILLTKGAQVELDSQDDRIDISKNNYFHIVTPSNVRQAEQELKKLRLSKLSDNGLGLDYSDEVKAQMEVYQNIIDNYNYLREISNPDNTIFVYNEKSKSISIRVIKNGKTIEETKNDPSSELGYIGSVVTNNTHTEYTLAAEHKRGIKFVVSRNKGTLLSNSDKLFVSLISGLTNEDGASKEDKHIAEILFELNSKKVGKERREYLKTVKDDILKYLDPYIKEGLIVANNDYDLEYTLNNQILPILFYEEADNFENYLLSYKQYIARVFNNYRSTYQIQRELENGKTVRGYLRTPGNRIVTPTGIEVDAASDFWAKNCKKLVYVSESGQFVFANSSNTTTNFSGTKAYNLGFAVTENSIGHGIAWVTNTNSLSYNKKLYKLLRETVHNLLLGEINGQKAINVNWLMDNFKWLFGKSSLFYGVDEKILRQNLNSLTNKSDIKEASQIAYDLADKILKSIKFNKSYFFASNVESTASYNNNPYFMFENGKITIKLNGEILKYNDYFDFAIRENAFKISQSVGTNVSYDESGDFQKDMYFSVYSIEDNVISPVEGDNVIKSQKVVADEIKALDKETPYPTANILKASGFEDSDIDFVLGKRQNSTAQGIPLIPEEIFYNNSKGVASEGFAYHDKNTGKIYLTSAGRAKLRNGIHREEIYRFLLHENIHKRFNELDDVDKQYIVKEINKIIREYLDYLVADDSDRAKEIKEVFFEKLDKNGNEVNHKLSIKELTKYFDRLSRNEVSYSEQESLVSEWLAESLSQNGIIEYLSGIQAKDYVSEEQTNKTLFQKIIDLILTFFGINLDISKNNSIFAKQYEIFSKTNRDFIKTSEIPISNNTVVETTEGDKTGENSDNTDNNSNELSEEDKLKEIVNIDNDHEDDSSSDDYTIDFVSTSRVGNYIEHRTNPTDINISQIETVDDMETFLQMFSNDEKLRIANLIKNGDLVFACK